MCAGPCLKLWASNTEKDSRVLCSGPYCLGSYILRVRRKQRDDKCNEENVTEHNRSGGWDRASTLVSFHRRKAFQSLLL